MTIADIKDKLVLPSITFQMKYSGVVGETDAVLLPSGNLSG